MAYEDLRQFIDDVEKVGELRRIEGADTELEIGAITEVAAESPSCPMLLFDKIKGYPAGHRIVTNLLHTPKRLALALGFPTDLQGVALVRAWKERIKSLKHIPPTEVRECPVQENVVSGEDVDVFALPAPRWHELDPGRYIGTGAITITRDPDGGWVNCGVFRVQVHDRSTLGPFINLSRHTHVIREKYWARGQNCPVAICTGFDPSLFLAGAHSPPFGVSEYDLAGGIREQSVEVIRGDYTGLPIPATAEIALEGEMPPPEVESRIEGPFGEATGYYASGAKLAPIMRVKRIMHRDNPILHGAPPMKPYPGLYHFGIYPRTSAVWAELEQAHINNVRGVWQPTPSFTIISMKQMHPGQAKRAALVAAGSPNLELSRFIVVVDEDIDPSNWKEVLWAMSTRCEPEESIEIVRGRTVDAIDPRISPENRARGNFTMSQVLIDACRPYHWKKEFPPVNEVSSQLKSKVLNKWSHVLS